MRRSPAPQLLLSDLPVRPALIGVSGGRDSVALLHALAAKGALLTVCHLDHALRAESAADAEFVRDLAKQLGFACEIDRADVAQLARTEKLSVETAARRARHSFFARTARTAGCHDVILAHHADDQVETFLLNLLRGAASAGLRGILATSHHSIDGMELEFHRPLLGVWRVEVDEYIRHHGLEYREDDSNRDPAYTRNRVRHEILPMLSKMFGRDVSSALWKAAEVSRADQEWLDALIAPLLKESPMLGVSEIRSLPTAAQRRVILQWLRTNGVPDIDFDDVELVRSLLSGGSPAKVNLSAGIHARRRSGVIFLDRPE